MLSENYRIFRSIVKLFTLILGRRSRKFALSMSVIPEADLGLL